MSTTLDLGALEQEGRPETLVVRIRDEEFTLQDPLLLPWDVYEEVDWCDSREILHALLPAGDYDRFVGMKVTQNGMILLGARINEHYFGTTPGESDASPTS